MIKIIKYCEKILILRSFSTMNRTSLQVYNLVLRPVFVFLSRHGSPPGVIFISISSFASAKLSRRDRKINFIIFSLFFSLTGFYDF